MHEPPASSERAVLDFLQDVALDRARGGLQPIAHYLSRYPGHEEAIAREYLSLRAGAASDRAEERAGRIGAYEIERELGRGGQGVVYLARDERLERRVALKVLYPGPFSGDDSRLRFRREAELCSKLDHPGICTVYEVGEHAGRDFLAMRYVEGETLSALIRRRRGESDTGAFTPSRGAVREVCLLVEQLARALHAAHEAGIVHRDVKSGNVMLSADGEPVVLDFGLARDATRAQPTLTASGDVFGTPAYMAPEQLAGPSRAVDRRADVWALGVVLHELLALERPFEGATAQAIGLAILSREPPPLRARNSAVSRDLEIVAATALEKDLARRYQTAADLAEDLRRVRALEPIRARPAGPLLRFRRWCQRNPALAASAGLLVLAAASIAALAAWFRGETDALAAARDVAIAHMTELSDDRLADELLARERDALWPIDSSLVARADAWNRDAADLLSRAAEHAATLSRLRERRAPDGAYAEDAERILDERLEGMLARMEQVRARRETVAQRRARAASLRARTVEGAALARWEACAARVARSPRYAGLALAPQEGLLPLGENPQGCEEFWLVESGGEPPIDPDRGAVLDESSGLVLVLIPGGRVLLGAHPTEGPRIDPRAELHERPLVEVELDAFLLSKHELTQGQWLRLFEGENPSAYPPGHAFPGGLESSRLHPVEQVGFEDARAACARLGLALPTEAQWERACRAGAETPWSFGYEYARAGEHGNFHGREANPYNSYMRVEEYSDAHVRTAPAGSFPPNGFGLLDMHGNVWEWCADPYRPYSAAAPRPGDGLLEGAGDWAERSMRGGAFTLDAAFGRSAARGRRAPDVAGYDCGLRPARALVR